MTESDRVSFIDKHSATLLGPATRRLGPPKEELELELVLGEELEDVEFNDVDLINLAVEGADVDPDTDVDVDAAVRVGVGNTTRAGAAATAAGTG